MKTLPDGWKKYNIRDIGTVVTGNTPPKNEPENYGGDLPWIKPPDLDNGMFVSTSEETISDFGRKKIRLLPKGSVLVSCIGNIGKVSIAECELCTNQQINSIIPNEEMVDSVFLYYTIKKIKPELEKATSSFVVPLLNKKDFSNIEFSIPPLPTQKKIAAVLEKAEKLKEWRKEADGLTDEFLKSTFLEMFGDPEKNPKKWEKRVFKDIIQEFRYGSSNKSSGDGYPILRIPNIIGGKINIIDLKYCKVTDEEYEKLKLLYGDILFVRTNGNQDYVGRSAIVEKSNENFIYASYLIRARINKKIIIPEYLKQYLFTTSIKKVIKSKTNTSAGQYNINTIGLGSIEILIPPIELQQKFASIVQQVEQIRQHQEQSKQQIDHFFNVLMQKSFKGELVI